MAARVGDRLPKDSKKCLFRRRGHLDIRIHDDLGSSPDTTRDLFDGLNDRRFERLVDRRRQGGDRAARLVQRALARCGQPPERVIVGGDESFGEFTRSGHDERKLLRETVV